MQAGPVIHGAGITGRRPEQSGAHRHWTAPTRKAAGVKMPMPADEPGGNAPQGASALSAASKLPGLSGEERKAVEEQSRPNATLIHETIRAEGVSELERTAHALLFSGVAAGLSMGFSLGPEGLPPNPLPDRALAQALNQFRLPLRFPIVVFWNHQPFTEN